MAKDICDVSQFLGGWSAQPEDSGCDLCAGVQLAPDDQSCDHRCTCGRALKCEGHVKRGVDMAKVYESVAIACADAALYAIERGSEDEAGQYAKDCLTACYRFQEAGGKPWD